MKENEKMHIQELGKILIFLGLTVAGVGTILMVLARIPFIGKLPGDILIQKKNVTFYFPVATSIIASIVVSLIAWLFSRR